MHYERPKSLKDATSLLAEAKGRAFVLAGGTDLLVVMKNDDFDADLVVDIKSIEGLDEIREGRRRLYHWRGGSLRGAWREHHAQRRLARCRRSRQSDRVTQIQGRCTVVGNLCNASPAADSVPALVAAGARAIIVGPEGTRTIAVEDVPVAPGKRRSQGRDYRGDRARQAPAAIGRCISCASFRAQKWTSPLSASRLT